MSSQGERLLFRACTINLGEAIKQHLANMFRPYFGVMRGVDTGIQPTPGETAAPRPWRNLGQARSWGFLHTGKRQYRTVVQKDRLLWISSSFSHEVGQMKATVRYTVSKTTFLKWKERSTWEICEGPGQGQMGAERHGSWLILGGPILPELRPSFPVAPGPCMAPNALQQ